MSAFLQDLRYSLRTLARNPGFTAVAVATLALLACWLPACKAARLDPIAALRQD